MPEIDMKLMEILLERVVLRSQSFLGDNHYLLAAHLGLPSFSCSLAFDEAYC
jgi:hypothetical protein